MLDLKVSAIFYPSPHSSQSCIQPSAPVCVCGVQVLRVHLRTRGEPWPVLLSGELELFCTKENEGLGS